jgi:exopolysaccharide biosynthesis protein
MDKRIFGVLLLGIACSFWFWQNLNNNSADNNLSKETAVYPVASPEPERPKIKTIRRGDNSYGYAFFESGDKIKLIGNYDQKETAKNISDSYECRFGINGGFYDKDGKALGWVVANGTNVSKSRTSNLFNGYLSLNSNNWTIGKSVPEGSENGLQSGPILIDDGKTTVLNLVNDKSARRMFAAITFDNTAFFGSVFDEKTPLLGPNLVELPEIIKEIGLAEKKKWVSAINLDGGSASAFKDGDFWLEEISPIGSWWCFW